MELKCRSGDSLARNEGSNRTFMELKFANQAQSSAELACSNRTFMELKLHRSVHGSNISTF